jgi:hypothetical protein
MFATDVAARHNLLIETRHSPIGVTRLALRYVAIHAPGLTILLSLPNYQMMTYCMMLGYTTPPLKVNDIVIPFQN